MRRLVIAFAGHGGRRRQRGGCVIVGEDAIQSRRQLALGRIATGTWKMRGQQYPDVTRCTGGPRSEAARANDGGMLAA
jgi:hypothetical protein